MKATVAAPAEREVTLVMTETQARTLLRLSDHSQDAFVTDGSNALREDIFRALSEALT